MGDVYLYEEFDPARWEQLLCPEMRACMAIVHAEGNGIARLGSENIKAPVLTAILHRMPGEAALEQLRAEAERLGGINVVADGVGCTRHYTGLEWSAPDAPKPDGPVAGWKARLRARLGLAPDPHAAVMAALRRDDRPLRAAYARVAHLTVADMRDRLAEPGDRDKPAWATFEHYRKACFPVRKADWRRHASLLWERDGVIAERAFRINGLDFAMIVTREQGGLIREVEFVVGAAEQAKGYVVRVA